MTPGAPPRRPAPTAPEAAAGAAVAVTAAGRRGRSAALVVALLLLAVPATSPSAAASTAPVATQWSPAWSPAPVPPPRGSAPAAVPAARGTQAWGWPLLLPQPDVVRPFDPPARRWLAGHRGVDLAAAPGRPVLSPSAGEVVLARRVVDRGVVVVRGPDGLRSTLEPVEDPVAVGTLVARGDPVGVLAAGHCPEGCLHWGVRSGTGRDAVYLDPLSLVGPPAPPVLLPLPPATGR